MPNRVEAYPIGSGARWAVLATGYSEPGVASTIALVQDGSHNIVIDPGMVRNPASIVRALARRSLRTRQITEVVLSHHHPDHTLNAGLFANASVHDHWAIYRADVWTDRKAEGYRLSPSVRLLATPGHTDEDITTVVGTRQGLVAFTHLWWNEHGPPEDPVAVDARALHRNRRRVLRFAAAIVPGHGAPFVPSSATAR